MVESNQAQAEVIGMGAEVTCTAYTREERQRYREKVRLDLDVFEQMLAQSKFDFDCPLTATAARGCRPRS